MVTAAGKDWQLT